MSNIKRGLSLAGLGIIALGTQLPWVIVDLTSTEITNFTEMPGKGLSSEVWGLVGLPLTLLVSRLG